MKVEVLNIGDEIRLDLREKLLVKLGVLVRDRLTVTSPPNGSIRIAPLEPFIAIERRRLLTAILTLSAPANSP